jgi:hypothetical protein
MKRPHPLPAGYHDAQSAALVLGMSKRQLLAHLRELGWLDSREGMRNMPRRDIQKKGLLTLQMRSYCLRGQREIIKYYPVMLLTPVGFRVLKSIIQPNSQSDEYANNEPISVNHHVPVDTQTRSPSSEIFNQHRADVARQQCLQHLAKLEIVKANAERLH